MSLHLYPQILKETTLSESNEIVCALAGRLDPNLRDSWEERSAIYQYEAGLGRGYAEALALLDLIHQNPQAVLACFQN